MKRRPPGTVGFLLLLALSLVVGCAAPAAVERDAWVPDPQAHLAYRVLLSSLGVATSVEVTLVVRAEGEAALPSPYQFYLPHRWAGYYDLHLDLAEFRAYSPDRQPLPLSLTIDRVQVSHAGLRQLVLQYRVAPRSRLLTGRSRFHAIGTPDLFFAYGRNLLVRPGVEMLSQAPAYLELIASRPGTRWATTVGAFPGHLGVLRAPLRDLLDAAYLGGRFRLVSRGEGQMVVTVAADPQLDQVEDHLLQLAYRLVSYTVQALGEPPYPSTVGLLVRRADGPGVMTGSGRPGGFVLELGDGDGLEPIQAALLIAHENLHRYIGNWLRFAPGQELHTMWFREGVVEYLSAQAVVRSGVGPPDLFYQVLSRVVTGYLWNACADSICDRSSQASFWENPALRQLSYQQGFLLAFWLDTQLRRSQDRLEGAVNQILRMYAGRQGISNADIRSVLEQRLGRDLGECFERFVSGRQQLPVHAWLSEVGLDLRQVREDTAYFGMEVAPDRHGVWHVHGIDPWGPAAGLSIHVGDALAGPPDVSTGGLGSRARFVVLRDGHPMDVWVAAQPGQRVRWEVYRLGSTFDHLMGW